MGSCSVSGCYMVVHTVLQLREVNLGLQFRLQHQCACVAIVLLLATTYPSAAQLFIPPSIRSRVHPSIAGQARHRGAHLPRRALPPRPQLPRQRGLLRRAGALLRWRGGGGAHGGWARRTGEVDATGGSSAVRGIHTTGASRRLRARTDCSLLCSLVSPPHHVMDPVTGTDSRCRPHGGSC